MISVKLRYLARHFEISICSSELLIEYFLLEIVSCPKYHTGSDDFRYTFFVYHNRISKALKINESQYITLFVVSGFIKQLFSIDFVNNYFSQSIVNYLFSIDLKVWGYPTLLISWFINFDYQNLCLTHL